MFHRLDSNRARSIQGALGVRGCVLKICPWSLLHQCGRHSTVWLLLKQESPREYSKYNKCTCSIVIHELLLPIGLLVGVVLLLLTVVYLHSSAATSGPKRKGICLDRLMGKPVNPEPPRQLLFFCSRGRVACSGFIPADRRPAVMRLDTTFSRRNR